MFQVLEFICFIKFQYTKLLPNFAELGIAAVYCNYDQGGGYKHWKIMIWGTESNSLEDTGTKKKNNRLESKDHWDAQTRTRERYV